MRVCLDEIRDDAALARRLQAPADARRLLAMSRPVLWAHRAVPAEVTEKLAQVLCAANRDRLPWQRLPVHYIPHLPPDCVYVVDAATLEPVDEDADGKE